MKHTNIAATLGWTETPDNTEGIFLQPEEAVAIDNALAGVGNTEETAANLVIANSAIATLEGTVEGLQAAVVTDAATITTLKEQVAELGKNPSGNGSVVKTGTEEEQEEAPDGKLPRYDSAEHPANKAAMRIGKFKKN